MLYRISLKDTRSITAFSSVMLKPSAVSVNCLRRRGRPGCQPRSAKRMA